MPNVPYTETGATGPFSTLENNIRKALMDMGETSPDTMISQMSGRLIACANRVVDEVNKHPTLLDLLDDDQQFDDVTGCSMMADSAILTVPSVPSNLNLYAPVMVTKVGHAAGPMISFVLGFPDSGQVRLADSAETTDTTAVLSNLYKSRIRRFTATGDKRYIDDLTIIEGIKYYWGIDESSMLSPSAMQKLSGRYYQTLNAWMASLANYQGKLENDSRQDRLDY